jgi:transposase
LRKNQKTRERANAMFIIGCDFHVGFQQLAIFDKRTGEVEEKRLRNPAEAEAFYRGLPGPALVGIEAGSPCQWFRRLLWECGHELWVGDAARIRAAEVRKQKNDRRDAMLLLRLLLEGRFPRIWVPSEAERDVRQLLMDRHHRMRARTRAKNQLQFLAMNQGVQKGRRLWSEAGRQLLSDLAMLPHAARRRDQLLGQLQQLDEQIAELDRLVLAEVQRRPDAMRLMTHPGVGPQTALATVLTLGEVSRFSRPRQVSSYLGLVPAEHSSGGKQRLGHISKQGSSLMRFLLVEAGQTAVRGDAELRRAYQRLSAKKGSRAVAKVMVARRLAVRLYWMLRNQWTYAELVRHAGEPGSCCEKPLRPTV